MLIRQTPEGKSHAPWMMALCCEIASRMVRRGVTEIRAIQREIDLWYGQRLRGT